MNPIEAHAAALARLSPEQKQVVDLWGQGMAVLAGAGSGKTTTLVVKCVELLHRRPEARLCAVSFTERSAGDLREKLSAQVPLPGHWVMTIHGLCGSIIRDFPRQAGCHGDERMLSEPEAEALWERAIEALWLDEIPAEIQAQTEILMEQESRIGLIALLRRVRSLSLQGALESLEQQQSDRPSQALASVGRYVLERYERLKRRRGALDFNDLEHGADRALNDPEVQRYYHRRFDLVMVDEFQDTNPLQARIVFRFCRPDRSNLCVVGDPKQSIYRFRDADVSVFEECCAELPARLSLTWNFRSRPGVIEFSNQVCAPAFEASQMVYEPLVPKRESVPGMESVVVLEDATPAVLADFIHGELSRGTALGEMALLLRKIRGKEDWLRGLTAAGIPIAVGSGGLFWEDPRVREMTAFLKWWDNPMNALSGAVFLRAPWVGIPDEELDRWIRRDPTFQHPFLESAHPLAARLKPLLGRSLRPGQLLMELLVDEKAERELAAPLLGLWHRAEELSHRGLDFHRVVQELGTAMEEKRRERDVPPPQSGDGMGQLVVLTVHASKGLEFPHVILLDLPEKPERARPAPMLFWDRRRGAFLGRRDEEGDRDKQAEAEWRDEEKRQELAESKRVFYVALTRARERIILAYPAGGAAPAAASAKAAADPDAERRKSLSSDHWRGWIEASVRQIPRIEIAQPSLPGLPISPADSLPTPATPARSEIRVPSMRPRHSVTEWNLLSRCSRAYAWTYLKAPLGVSDPVHFTRQTEPTDVEISQRELGSRVHECLETLDWEGLRALEAEAGSDRFMAEPVIRWAHSSEFMRPSGGRRRVWSETGFESPVSGEVLVGSIDRLVRREDGRYEVIDFKVTRRTKDSGTLLASYSTQLRLYVWALGTLQPDSRDQTRALLVNFSPDSIETVEVPLPRYAELENEAANLAKESARWVAELDRVDPARVPPRPGSHCAVCEFRTSCEKIGS